MATIFGTTNIRGCFGVYGFDLSEKSAVTLATPGSANGNFGASGIWCINIGVNAKENNAILPCFNDSAYQYAFGHDPVQSNFSVTFLCASVQGSSGGSQIPSAVQLYKTSRVSQTSKESSLVMYGSVLAAGSIVSYAIATANVEMKLYNVTFNCSMISLSAGTGGGSGSGNGGINAHAYPSAAAQQALAGASNSVRSAFHSAVGFS